MTKELNKKIRQLKQEISELDEEIRNLEYENSRLKEWIRKKFDWWIELSANKDRPCLKWLIKNTAEVLGMK